MRSIIIFLLLLFFLLIGTASAKQVSVLEDQVNPFYMRVDNHRLYISEGPRMSVYSLPELKLLATFGRKGEGPGEFVVSPNQNLGSFLFDIMDGKIIVQSIGKVSWFSRTGKLLRELKTGRFGLKPAGKGYAGFGSGTGPRGLPMTTINLYDEHLDKTRELSREPAFYFSKPEISPFDLRSSLFMVSGNRIIVEREKNMLSILDLQGNTMATIKPESKPVPLTKKHRAEFVRSLSLIPQLKNYFESFRSRLRFPETFPKISMFDVFDGHIYIITYSQHDQGRKVLVYDLEGKFLGVHYLKEYLEDIFYPGPYAFSKTRFYQIVESRETGNCELHITDLGEIQ